VIDEDFAKKYKLPTASGPQKRCVQYMDREVTYETHDVLVTLVAQDKHTPYELIANTIPNFSQHSLLHDWSEDLHNYPYMTNVIVPSYPYPPLATMLIGVDNLDLLTDIQTKSGGPKDPQARRTALGWGFLGPTKNCGEEMDSIFYSNEICFKATPLRTNDDYLFEIVKRDFELASFGLEERENPFTKGFSGGPKDPSTWTLGEKMADDKLVITHHKGEKYFEASIPWQDDHENKLKNNYTAVKIRQDRSHTKEALAKKRCST